MTNSPLSRRTFAKLVGMSAALAAAPAWPICASPNEMGRWRNMAEGGDPAVLDLKMTECGDQVLNGEQTETRYKMRVWVRQSGGNYYGRPSVRANVRTWKGQKWFVGRVPTGGYVDNVWARVERQGGERRLHVLIRHESLDSKPSASSEHWFRFEKSI